MRAGQRRGPLRDPGPPSRARGGRASAVAGAARAAPGGRLRRAAQGRPPRHGALCLGALLGAPPPRRPDSPAPGHRPRRRGHAPGRRGRPARAAGAGGGLDRRRALPGPAPTGVRSLRPRTPSEHAFLALGTEAEDYLRAAAAAGTARLHERLDEALGLARTRGEQQAKAALACATTFGRFAHGDLGSIADGLKAAPPTAVADAAPLSLEGLPKVAVRSLTDYRQRRA